MLPRLRQDRQAICAEQGEQLRSQHNGILHRVQLRVAGSDGDEPDHRSGEVGMPLDHRRKIIALAGCTLIKDGKSVVKMYI